MIRKVNFITTAAVAAVIIGQSAASAHHGPCGTMAAGCGPFRYGVPDNVERYPAHPLPFHSMAAGCPSIGSYPPTQNCIPGSGCSGDYAFPDDDYHAPYDMIPPVSSPYYWQPQPPDDDASRWQSAPIGPPSAVQPGRLPAHPPQSGGTPTIPDGMEGIAGLPQDEQAVALRQKTCPVTGELLGSMGKPIQVPVADRSVFVCCEGCVAALRRNPAKYLRSAFRTRPGTLR